MTKSRASGRDNDFSAYRKAAAFIQRQLEERKQVNPIVGIICGSGLSGLSTCMTDTVSFAYSDIPGFPPDCSVQGHKGEMVIGNLSDVPTVCFRGRFHSYEGHPMSTVVLPVRVMRCLGVKAVVVTNAAGGLNSKYNVGDVVNVMDHIALPMMAGNNPLKGENDDRLGDRFVPTSNIYDVALQDLLCTAANTLNFQAFLRTNGTYCFVSGPMYETKSESCFLRKIGGDLVGMSTIPEVVVAHHCGMKVICLSLITNKVIMPGDEATPAASHQEVLDSVNLRSKQIMSLVQELIHRMKDYLADLPQFTPINLDLALQDQQTDQCSSTCRVFGIPLHCIYMSAGLVALASIATASLIKKK